MATKDNWAERGHDYPRLHGPTKFTSDCGRIRTNRDQASRANLRPSNFRLRQIRKKRSGQDRGANLQAAEDGWSSPRGHKEQVLDHADLNLNAHGATPRTKLIAFVKFIESRRLCDLTVVFIVQDDIKGLNPISTFPDAVDNIIAINLLQEELTLMGQPYSDADLIVQHTNAQTHKRTNAQTHKRTNTKNQISCWKKSGWTHNGTHKLKTENLWFFAVFIRSLCICAFVHLCICAC